jgi:hypothetical protein
VVYRVKQFFDALAARTDENDERELARLLTPPQRELFRRMAPNDQRHALNVCATLRQAGHDDPDLLKAALLHDAGKAAGRIWLWQRTLIVLLQRWAPDVLRWLSRGDSPAQAPRWRRGFVVNRLHPELGAQWAAQAGCLPTTVALIRRHQDPVQGPGSEARPEEIKDYQERLLVALQWADGVN